MACSSCTSLAPFLLPGAGAGQAGRHQGGGRGREERAGQVHLENWGADERAETADEAELAGDKANAGVDKEADQEDMGGLG